MLVVRSDLFRTQRNDSVPNRPGPKPYGADFLDLVSSAANSPLCVEHVAALCQVSRHTVSKATHGNRSAREGRRLRPQALVDSNCCSQRCTAREGVFSWVLFVQKVEPTNEATTKSLCNALQFSKFYDACNQFFVRAFGVSEKVIHRCRDLALRGNQNQEIASEKLQDHGLKGRRPVNRTPEEREKVVEDVLLENSKPDPAEGGAWQFKKPDVNSKSSINHQVNERLKARQLPPMPRCVQTVSRDQRQIVLGQLSATYSIAL